MKEPFIKLKLCTAIASVILGNSIMLPSHAEEAGYQLEEVVVSARRRSENLKDVPVAITALSSDFLRDAAIDDIVAISELTPGLNIEPGVDDNTARFFIRGVGTATPDVGNEPAVPMYIDDIYIPSGIGSKFDLFALDRVEVLRGPQGTLYGRNSFGGAIKVYTKNVEVEELEGSISYTSGTAGRGDIKAEARIPVIQDKLWLGAGYAHLENDGYQDLINTGAKGWVENSDIYKLKLAFHPSEKIRLGFTYDQTDKDAPAKFGKIRNIGNDIFNGGVTANFPGAVPNLLQQSSDPDDIETDLTSNSVLDLTGYSWRAEVDINDKLTAKYIGSTRELYNRRIFDIDGTAAPFLAIVEDYDLEADSHEIQLNWSSDRLQLVGGLYYYEEDTASLTLEAPNNFLLFDPATTAAGTLLTDIQGRQTASDVSRLFTRVRQNVESTAIYINGTYEVTEKLNVSAGIRWTKDEKVADTPIDGIAFVGGTFNRTLNVAPPGRLDSGIIERFGGVVTNSNVTPSGEGAQDYSEVTPAFTLDYKLDDDSLIYASYRRGFLSGVIYPIGGSIEGAEIETEQQALDAFELGYKATYERFEFNVAAYYYDFDGLAVSVNTPVPPAISGTGFAAIPTNADSASTKGLEFDFRYSVTDNFFLSGNFAYTDFDLEDVQGAVDTDGDGVPDTTENIADTFLDVAQLTPEFQYALAADYHIDMADKGSLALNTRVSWRDEISTNAAPAFEAAGLAVVPSNPATDDIYISDSFTNVAAGITYTSADESWRVALTGNNLLDERRPVATVFAVPDFLGALTQFNEPRTWALSVAYDF